MSASAEPLGPAIGGQLLSELGFLHVPGPPLTASRAYLFIALRRPPTLRHFDPERVSYWTAEGHAGVPATIEPGARRIDRDFAWGTIRIVDRLGMVNDYVAFGGGVTTERVDDVTVAVFSSDAPILARGGHSQGWDPLAEEIAAFDARLRAAVGRSRELERSTLELGSVGVYAAFIVDTLARETAAARLVAWHPTTQALLRREARRVAGDHPLDWDAGGALARTMAGEERR